MKNLKIITLILGVLFLNSCASGYKSINPAGLSYNSIKTEKQVSLEYKYDLLEKKYSKKEQKKDVRLVAVKITNNSDRDLVFGEDLRLTYENGSDLLVLERDKIFSSLKQKPATYLFYLLLTPLTLTVTTTNDQYGSTQTNSNSMPAGLILGPGLAGGNLYHSARANKKFKEDLMGNDLAGTRIARGQTVYGLIGIRADNYDALNFTIKEPQIKTGKQDIAP